MTVAYPRKVQGKYGVRDAMPIVVRDRDLHLQTLNNYRYNEQRSCYDLTKTIELLDGEPRELIRDLSHHITEESRHALWLTDLLSDIGGDINGPSGKSYIDEFERLLDGDQVLAGSQEDLVINVLVSINMTEKRGCETFSAHIEALKQVEQTPENLKIRKTLERIFPEEAVHVRWGTKWLAKIARKSPIHRQKVDHAKRKYAAIEQAAYEATFDMTFGAEFRRLEHLLEISKTMPLWKRTQYFVERFPETLLDPTLQLSRLKIVQKAWQRDPQLFLEKFLPLMLTGNLSTIEAMYKADLHSGDCKSSMV